MATINLIRRFIPTGLRVKVYVWVIAFVGKSKLLLSIYLYLLHGCIPDGITVIDKKPVYHYKGIKIDSPRDSIEAYVEVFHDNVYDRVAVPKVGNVVIDVGAYVGMYSIKASQYVGDTGLVIAVEPLPANLVYLEKNTRGLPNIKMVNVALSNYVGVGKLYSSPSTAVHSMVYVRHHFTKINVTTLDEMVRGLGLTRVDYIKMDAEGSDLCILEGGLETLRDMSPVLSMACYHKDADGIPYTNKVIAYLKNIGYKCITEKGYVYARKERKQ